MTSHYEMIETKQLVKTLVKVTCDRCDEIVPDEEGSNFREITIEFYEGYREHGYGASTEKVLYDLCKACESKLLQLLEENGYKLDTVENVWP